MVEFGECRNKEKSEIHKCAVNQFSNHTVSHFNVILGDQELM